MASYHSSSAMTDDELDNLESNYAFSCLLGYVETTNVKEVKANRILQELEKLGGKRYRREYSKHFVPSVEAGEKLYMGSFKSEEDQT